MTPAISVVNLGKAYNGRWVVDGLSFEVGRGEVFALLGPNGAGKTTTIEILEGYRSADRGEVRVLDLSPRSDHTTLMRRAGLMLQQGGIYPGIRVREVLELFSHFYPDPIEPEQLIRDMGLSDVAGSRYRLLSGGQQQRLSLALALIGRPELVFLDEPTAGMDPQARRATWDIIRALRSRGVTVLLTTHFMDEAEELADRAAIVDRGHLVALDEPDALRRSGPATRVLLTARAGVELSLLSALASAGAIREERPGRYEIETQDPGALLVELTTALRAVGIIPDELRVGGESLEDVFLRLTGSERPT
ncbi:MAG TPA: ABC transporter ATP-binding protein [Dehalococcoidia bacterium]|nr:ABC transporter ATP-binding protein [Dehalococcoidia bacterium]